MSATTIATALRDPMPLPQVTRNSCQSCVTAQARWMLGLSDLTGQRAVREVNRMVTREPDGRVAPVFCLPPLLAGGCQVVRYGKPDPDMARFEAEGLAYFAEYYSDDWEASDGTFWTPPQLAAWAERTERELALQASMEAQYGSAMAKAGEWFSLAAAVDLLAAGYVIMTTYVPEDAAPDMCHATLLYGLDGSGLKAYTPCYGDPGLEVIPLGEFARMLRPYAEAVRRI
jgi:hypothetical protein